MPLKKNQRTIGSLSLSLLLVVTSLRLADVRAEEQEAHTGTLKNWELYGSVRMEGAYWQRYKWYEHLDPLTAARINYDSLKSEGFIVSKGGMDSVLLDTLPVTQLRMGLQNNSYFGVRGKGDRFGFCFEMGLGAFLQDVGLLGTQQSDISELSLSSSKRQSTVLRKVYGDWYILKDRGKGIDYLTLRIGQDWNIANFFPSGQVFNSDAGLGYSGILYTGRKPQVKLSLGNKEHTSVPWNIQAAVIKQDLYTVPNYGTNGYLQKTEEELPKFEFGGQEHFYLETQASLALPGMSGFMAKSYESALKKDFYTLKEEVDKAANTMNDLKTRSPHEIEGFLAKEENISRLGLQKSVNKIGENLSSIRKAIAQISNSDMPADAKREQLKELRDAEEAMLKGVDVKMLRQLGKI